MSVIGLKKANCQNCYKCIKVCPVKSIKVSDEQAQIIDSDCILCGKCLNACPQNAKTLSSDIDKVKGFFKNGKKVLVSLAPSYFSSFSFSDERKLVGALKKLGFAEIAQTSDGAAYVTAEYHRLMKEGDMDNIITTCCPTVNALAEKYYPSILPMLAPVLSPMVAHGRLLKQTYGNDCKVVFIGPCIAKKDEADDIRHQNEIDAVLTFNEIVDWLEEENISIEEMNTEEFLRNDSAVLRLYPIAGGIVKSLKKLGDIENLGYNVMCVDGIDSCKELFNEIRDGQIHNSFIEINACDGGCINGPARNHNARDRFTGRLEIRNHVEKTDMSFPPMNDHINMNKEFLDRTSHRKLPTEEEIRQILKRIGKTTPEQELNCGSCGYPTCRDKAIAVYQGKADLQMCMPYMRERAESLSNFVLSETPNITVIVDQDLNIIEFNHAAEKAFGITRSEALQKGIYEVIDATDFLRVLDTKTPIFDKKVTYEMYDNITTLQTIIYISEGHCAMGIFKDITAEEKHRESQYQLKMDTVDMAQKVIDKQMMVAQEIASLLGETTAETKVTLTKLKNMIASDGDGI